MRQFLDIGTGIPTSPNLHEVAQQVAPEARVVYVDNDPIVLAHARALLASSSEGRSGYVSADLREPERILGSSELTTVLDLEKPVVLSLNALLHFFPDDFGASQVIARLVDALASGSYLVLTQGTGDFAPEWMAGAERAYEANGVRGQLRNRAEFESFFRGMEFVDPGITLPHRWRPESTDDGFSGDMTDAEVSLYAGVARKP